MRPQTGGSSPSAPITQARSTANRSGRSSRGTGYKRSESGEGEIYIRSSSHDEGGDGEVLDRKARRVKDGNLILALPFFSAADHVAERACDLISPEESL